MFVNGDLSDAFTISQIDLQEDNDWVAISIMSGIASQPSNLRMKKGER